MIVFAISSGFSLLVLSVLLAGFAIRSELSELAQEARQIRRAMEGKR